MVVNTQRTNAKGEAMTGTLRTTENGIHTWTKGVTIDNALARFAKLGTVKRIGNSLTVDRFCGGKIKAEFFPKS